MQLEPGNEFIQTLSPLQVWRQKLAVEANTGVATVSDLGHLNVDISSACLDRAIG